MERNYCVFALILMTSSFVMVATEGSEDEIAIVNVYATEGGTATLPCNISAPQDDSVVIVIWYRNHTKAPFHTVDMRGRGSEVWSAAHVGDRVKFRIGSPKAPKEHQNNLHDTGWKGKANHWNKYNRKNQHEAGSSPTAVLGQAGLDIRNARKSDEGQYRCRVDLQSSPTRNTEYRLYVVDPPRRVQIFATGREPLEGRVSVAKGEPLTPLLCVVEGGDPSPSITWWSGNTPLSSQSTESTPPIVLSTTDNKSQYNMCPDEESGGYSQPYNKDCFQRELRRSFSDSDDQNYYAGDGVTGPVAMEMLRARKSSTGKYWAAVMKTLDASKESGSNKKMQFFTKELRLSNVTQAMIEAGNITCKAANNPELTPVTSVLKIIPFVPPLQLSLNAPNLPLLGGREYSLSCVADGVYPSPVLHWAINGRLLHENTKQKSKGSRSSTELVLKASAADNGAVLECSATALSLPHLRVTANVTLSVSYIPNATLRLLGTRDENRFRAGDKATFECNADANPPMYTVSLLKNGRTIVREKAIEVVENRIFIHNITSEDAGLYTCVASNSVGDGQSNAVQLKIDFIPECSISSPQQIVALAGETVELTCGMSASPQSSLIYEWWTSDGHDDERGPVSRRKINHEDHGDTSVGWFTISNSSSAKGGHMFQRHRKSDSSFARDLKNQYFDLRPQGYKKTVPKSGNEIAFVLKGIDNSKSKRENTSLKTGFQNDNPLVSKSDLILSDMAMADDIYENYHNGGEIGKRHFTDYQKFLSTIDSEDSNYQWSRLAAEILKRSDRSADFIGHKIEHISHKQHPRYGKRRKNHMPALLNKYFSFESKPPHKRKTNNKKELKKSQKVNPKTNNKKEFKRSQKVNSMEVSSPEMSSAIKGGAAKMTQTLQVELSPSSHQKKTISKETTPTHRYKRQTKEEMKSKNLVHHRVECWAKNEIGASSQPCIFMVSRVEVPGPVSNCSGADLTPFSAVVSCSPGTNGGLPTHYLLEVRESGGVSVMYETTWHEPKFSIENLKPGSGYIISVRAVHDKGRSAAQSFTLTTKPRPPHQDVAPETVRANLDQGNPVISGNRSPNESSSKGIIMVVSVAASGIVAVAIIAALIIRCHAMWAKSRSCSGSSNKSNTNDSPLSRSKSMDMRDVEEEEEVPSIQEEKPLSSCPRKTSSRESLSSSAVVTLIKRSPSNQDGFGSMNTIQRHKRCHSSKSSLNEKAMSPDVLPRQSTRSSIANQQMGMSPSSDNPTLNGSHLNTSSPPSSKLQCKPGQDLQPLHVLNKNLSDHQLLPRYQPNPDLQINQQNCIPQHRNNETVFIHPNPASYSTLTKQMHQMNYPLPPAGCQTLQPRFSVSQAPRNYAPVCRPGFDGNLSAVMSSGSQIVPVLLHDPTMISPAPSSCSSVDSSTVNSAQLSPSSSGHSSNYPSNNSNTNHLSTFQQHPSPSHINKNLVERKTRTQQPSHQNMDQHMQMHNPNCNSNSDPAAVSLASQIHGYTNMHNRNILPAPQQTDLKIDLENLPPPPDPDLRFTNNKPSEQIALVDKNSVLDHRELQDASDISIGDTGTIRRSNKATTYS